jgi:hypothetical protein
MLCQEALNIICTKLCEVIPVAFFHISEDKEGHTTFTVSTKVWKQTIHIEAETWKSETKNLNNVVSFLALEAWDAIRNHKE